MLYTGAGLDEVKVELILFSPCYRHIFLARGGEFPGGDTEEREAEQKCG